MYSNFCNQVLKSLLCGSEFGRVIEYWIRSPNNGLGSDKVELLNVVDCFSIQMNEMWIMKIRFSYIATPLY